MRPCYAACSCAPKWSARGPNASPCAPWAPASSCALRGDFDFCLRACMFACIYIPDFPVAAIIRAEPLLRDRAVAVLDGKPPQVRVAALNDKARLLGMEFGMTKVQAAIFAIPPQEADIAVAKIDRKKKPSQIE